MTSLLFSLVGFVIAIGVLVTIHEFGHFWVARRAGVKVLRFSVGFGRPLWTRHFGADRTEFVLAAIPLGGYVRMLDEREGEVAAGESHRAFNRKSLGARSAIVAAGPAANFLFAIVAYSAMFMIGVSGVAPILGPVEADTPAERAGFVAGDRLLSVAGQSVAHWEEAGLKLLDAAVDAGTVRVVVRDADGAERQRDLQLDDRQAALGEGHFLRNIGMQPGQPRIDSVLGTIEPGSAAERAGLREGDRILAVGGEAVTDWANWVERVQAHPQRAMQVRLRTADGSIEDRVVTPDAIVHGENGETIGRIGARVALNDAALAEWRVLVRQNPLAALGSGVVRTWEVSSLTVRMLWRMLTGEASLKNISGPVTIAEYAGTTVQIGVVAFLGFLALISISLGIINLLPVPMLDGGHLLFYAAEWVRGSAVSERTQILGQQVGLVIIAGLMFLAIYNDFARLLL